MPSDRVQRQIESLLDQAEAALAAQDWRAALQAAEAARGFDPDNSDAAAFVTAAERAIAAGGDSPLPAGEGSALTIAVWIEQYGSASEPSPGPGQLVASTKMVSA